MTHGCGEFGFKNFEEAGFVWPFHGHRVKANAQSVLRHAVPARNNNNKNTKQNTKPQKNIYIMFNLKIKRWH